MLFGKLLSYFLLFRLLPYYVSKSTHLGLMLWCSILLGCIELKRTWCTELIKKIYVKSVRTTGPLLKLLQFCRLWRFIPHDTYSTWPDTHTHTRYTYKTQVGAWWINLMLSKFRSILIEKTLSAWCVLWLYCYLFLTKLYLLPACTPRLEYLPYLWVQKP